MVLDAVTEIQLFLQVFADVYVLALGISLLVIQPDLIDGPGAIDVRFAAVFPLALVAFGQTLAMLTRGIDLSVGGVMSMTTALLATSGIESLT